MTFKAFHRWTNEGKILSTTVIAFLKRVHCPPHAPSTRRLTLLPSIETWILLGALRSFLDHTFYMLIPTLLLGRKHMTHSPCAACLQAVFLAPLPPQESRGKTQGRRKMQS